LGAALALLLAGIPTAAIAAVNATLSSRQGKPGDIVVITIPSEFSGLQSASPLPAFLIRPEALDRVIAQYGHNECSAEGPVRIGSVVWSGNTGTLVFTVPDIPEGQYYLEVEVRGAYPSCWRVGDAQRRVPGAPGDGVLVFEVLDKNADPVPLVATPAPDLVTPPGGVAPESVHGAGRQPTGPFPDVLMRLALAIPVVALLAGAFWYIRRRRRSRA
jgi:hypothetical protein